MMAKIEIAAALMAGALHEQRNLLAVAASSAYLAKQKQHEPEALARQLDKLERQIAAARDLVERLVAVAKGAPLERESVLASSVVDDALRQVELAEDVVAVRAVPADLRVVCDGMLLARAVASLVENAAAALAPRGGGRIEIAATSHAGSVEIAVSDDGPGIEGDPFAGATTKADGAGLGLLVVRGLAAAHGGELRFDPLRAPRSGARFVLSLPAD
jgi:signal transduction histidine kinase